MLRLDVFTTKCSLYHMAGWDNSRQIFGGYMMVASIVDMRKIHWQVFLWEFSRFYEKVKEADGNAGESILESIKETEKLLKATGALFEEAKEVKPGSNWR